jgi:DNA-3-methyladenine glycosylase
LNREFYARDVQTVARELLGAVVRYGDCAGIIVETEAYHQSEPACHAYVGRTARTETLFGAPGHAYVYRSYGIHALLNAVAEAEGVGAAALIRALEPLDGVDLMRARRGVSRLEDLCSGPGKLTQAMGITLADNGADLDDGPLLIERPTAPWAPGEIVASVRVGITKAVALPWRYSLAGSRFVSRPRPRR